MQAPKSSKHFRRLAEHRILSSKKLLMQSPMKILMEIVTGRL